MTNGKIKVWCLMRDQFLHVKPVKAHMGTAADFIYDAAWDPAALLAAEPDLVLCVNDFQYDIAVCLEAARRAKIPSLVLQDGILEWRCQYENPLFGAGGGAPQHQPVLADKIACLGAQSARQIAAWGNPNKVEVTGMPRLDGMRQRSFRSITKPGKRLLVMTAKKPWFTDAQREVTLRSLFDLKSYFTEHPDIEVVWRLTKDVSEILGVENRLRELATPELADVLDGVDAVISMVSTTLLESMLAQRPVAALDYHNPPRFVQTAWTISSREQIPSVIPELLTPPYTKMNFQQECLADTLYLNGMASFHVADLITHIAKLGREARNKGTALDLPAGLLAPVPLSISGSLPMLDKMYPGQAIYQDTDLQLLQVKLARAQAEIDQQKKQLASWKIGYWFQKMMLRLYSKGRKTQ